MASGKVLRKRTLSTVKAQRVRANWFILSWYCFCFGSQNICIWAIFNSIISMMPTLLQPDFIYGITFLRVETTRLPWHYYWNWPSKKETLFVFRFPKSIRGLHQTCNRLPGDRNCVMIFAKEIYINFLKLIKQELVGPYQALDNENDKGLIEVLGEKNIECLHGITDMDQLIS